VAVILGLAVAATYGAADFFGGMAAKKSPLVSVVVLSQLVGLPAIALLAPFVGGEMTVRVALLAAVAGVAGGTGLTCLYNGLAKGRMSVVAPITAVGAATLPVLWGLASGERPSPVALSGVAIALVAVVFVSRIPGDEAVAAGGRMVLGLAVLAGAGFGVVFVILGVTGDDAGLWPLLTMRATSLSLLAGGAVVTGRSLAPARAALPVIAAAGVLDMTANALYVFGTRAGLISLVAVLGSLYPAMTVLLARLVLSERLGRMQSVGLALAGAGVVLIAAG
jgi:uncharacterized membrane protein